MNRESALVIIANVLAVGRFGFHPRPYDAERLVLKCIEVRAPLRAWGTHPVITLLSREAIVSLPAALTVNATECEARRIRWKRSSALLSQHTDLFRNPIPVELRPLNVTRVTSTTLSRHRKGPSFQWRLRRSSDKVTESRVFLRLSATSPPWFD